MGAATILYGEESALIQIRADQAILRQPEAIAAIGLSNIPWGCVREMDTA
jgi:hypothetical protein